MPAGVVAHEIDGRIGSAYCPPMPADSSRKTTFGEVQQDRYRELVDELERATPGVTQAALAERLGIRPDHLARVRKGTRRVSTDLLLRAAKRLNFDPIYFDLQSGGPYQTFQASAHKGAPETVRDPVSSRARFLLFLESDAATERTRELALACMAAVGNQSPELEVLADEFARAVLGLPAVRLAQQIADGRGKMPRRELEAHVAHLFAALQGTRLGDPP